MMRARMMIVPRPVRCASSIPARPWMRPADDAHQVVDGRVGVADQVDDGIDHLAQIVGRDVGGHADGDAARAVDQEVRHAGRQDARLLLRVVEVGLEVDALLVDVGQELGGDPREARLRVPVRGRGVTVDRPEVPLAVDERVAHRERLGEADHRVVDGGVAVRVVVGDDVADDLRALLGRRAGPEVLLTRAEQDAPVHGLQSIPHVGDRAPDDHAHRVIQVRGPHLVLDRDRYLLRRSGTLRLRHAAAFLPH
jgi:hypothetical protein